jgi:hypothetical protein
VSGSVSVSEPAISLGNLVPLKLKKLGFLKMARGDDFLYRFDQESIETARSLGADIFAFPDRPWMGEHLQLRLHDEIDIALLSFNSFDSWFSSLPRPRRKQIRRCHEEGVQIQELRQPSPSEAQEILDLYHESPFREGRYFVGYHSWNLHRITEKFKTNDELVTSVALYDGKIVGVAKAKFRGQVATSNSVLSSLTIRRRVHGVANSLLANQIRMLADRGVRHLKYGKLGVGLEGLDEFKISNGFRAVRVNYNYALLTKGARICAKFGLYQPLDMIFSTKLRSVIPILSSLQPHLPVKMIQKLHLYA